MPYAHECEVTWLKVKLISAIIFQMDSTILVYPEQTATVDEYLAAAGKDIL